MLLLTQQNNNPFHNIATEEVLIKSSSDEFLILYRNTPCVVVGKHQNALNEVDIDYAEEHGISIVRRISGGGAVYHDLGNLNFAFIQNGTPSELVNFRKFTEPVIDFLKGLKLNAAFAGKNSIVVNGLKVSGNAEHVYKNRVLHHGTLLFSTNLKHLERLLHIPNRYESKAVKSIRASVTNIADHLNQPITVEEFTQKLIEYVYSKGIITSSITLPNALHEQIEILAHQKYATWEWNFGYSPSYTLHRTISIYGAAVEVTIEVEKGVISRVDTHSTTSRNIRTLLEGTIGITHSKSNLSQHLFQITNNLEEAGSIARSMI